MRAVGHWRLHIPCKGSALSQFRDRKLSVTALSQWVKTQTQEERQKDQILSIKYDRSLFIRSPELSVSPPFRIAGVSFDNRQTVLEKVMEGDAVLFEKEPHNDYDENAVRISLLDGSQLGYVPREYTSLFGPLTSGGRIKSIGSGRAPYVGAFVQGFPRVPFLIPPFLPQRFLDFMDPFKKFSAEQLQSTTEFLKRQHEGCALTGVEEDLVPCTFWRAHPKMKQFEMSGIRLVNRQLFKVMTMQTDQDKHLGEILATVNGWTSEEAEKYIHTCLERRNQADAEWIATTGAFSDLCRELNISMSEP